MYFVVYMFVFWKFACVWNDYIKGAFKHFMNLLGGPMFLMHQLL